MRSQATFLVYLQAAQNGGIHVAATDQAEGEGGVKEHSTGNGGNILTAGVGNIDILVFIGGNSAHTHNAVFGLEEYFYILRQEVGNHLGHTDTQVDHVAILQEAGCTLCNDRLYISH